MSEPGATAAAASAAAHLQLAVAFSLLLFPLLLSALLAPILRATQHAPYPRSAPLVLASLAVLGLAGVCGLAGLAGGRASAATLGGVLLVLAQLSLDVHLLLATLELLEKSPHVKPAVGLLSALLVASSVLHIVQVATPTNDDRSIVVPALRTVAHVLFDLAVGAVLARDVSLALIELSSLPSNTRERSSPEPQDGGVTRTQLGKERVRQFSNPWRPASLHDQSESRIGSGDNSLLHVLLQLRSFRLIVFQSISITLFITAASLPPSHDYSSFTKSGRVMATVFGTTTSPAGYLALTILALLRWTGVGIDLALRNGPAPPTSPPPSPSGPLRSFGLRSSHPTTTHRSLGPISRPLYPPPPSSPTPSLVPSRSNTSRHAVHSYDARKSPLILPASRQRHESRGSSSSQCSLPPPVQLFPPRLDTPPISGVDLADGLGITFPTTGSSHTFGAGGSGSGSGRRSKTRPSVAALHLSLVESPSPTFDRSGMLTPTTPRIPRTPLRRVGSVDRISAPLELEVEGGDPFSRDPSAEALVEMWKRDRDGVDQTETSLSGSLLRALEDVMEAGRDTASEPDDAEYKDYGAHEADRTVSSTFMEDLYEDAMTRPTPQTPEPQAHVVNVIAATPSTTTDSANSSPRARRPTRIPVPVIHSNIDDPFPAPSFASRSSSSPPTFSQLGTPSRRSSTSRTYSERSIPPPRPYQSTPPVSPTPSRASYAHSPPSPTSLWSSAPSSALRKVLRREHSRKRSQDSSHSDESFSCVGEIDRASVASFTPGHRHDDSSDDVVERLEHPRRNSDSPGSAGLKQLRLPGLVSVQEEGSGSSSSSIKARYRRREKRSWWNLSSTTASSRPATPSSPTLWSGLQIRHSSSFPALNELRRADGLPASSIDYSGARSDTRMSAPAGRRSRLFGSSSPERPSSTPRPAGAKRDSGSGSGSSSHLQSSSDSHHNHPMPQRHHYRQVPDSSPPSAHRPPPRKPVSRIPVPRRLVPTSEPESPSSGPDITFDSILNWDLPRSHSAGPHATQLHPHVDAAHFGFRRPTRAQNYSSTSSASAFSARDTLASMCGSDRPLVTHSRESTLDETPPPRTRSRPASLDSTRGFLRDTLAALDSPTSSSSAAMSPRSDFGWAASPASDSTGFSDSSEPPGSPWVKDERRRA